MSQVCQALSGNKSDLQQELREGSAQAIQGVRARPVPDVGRDAAGRKPRARPARENGHTGSQVGEAIAMTVRDADKNDATWLAELLAMGRIRGSFVPRTPIQELRDLAFQARLLFWREKRSQPRVLLDT